MNTIPPICDAQGVVYALEKARESDKKNGTPSAGLSTKFSAVARRALPIHKSQMVRAQQPITARAIGDRPSSAYVDALAALEKLHKRYRKIIEQLQKIQVHLVKAEYFKIRQNNSHAVFEGDIDSISEMGSEKDVESRFESQRSALQAAMSKLGHEQTKHALVLAREIDSALSKFCENLEARDEADCRDFGIELEHSTTTRLAQAVRVQFKLRTIELTDFEGQSEHSVQACFAKGMFEDFVAEIANW